MYKNKGMKMAKGSNSYRTLRFIKTSFAYDANTVPIFEDLTLHCDRGWTGVIGANGVGKSLC